MKNQLFNKSEKEYGENYHSHFFDQYRMYIESAEKISDRRQNANKYFLTINTVLISLLGLSIQIKSLGGIDLINLSLLITFLGVVICIIFWFLLNSYKQLNSGKFKIIHEIEDKLPMSIYDYEWNILGEGRKRKIYFPFSHVELLIPILFGFIYLALFFIFYVTE